MTIRKDSIRFWLIWGIVLALASAAGTWSLSQYLVRQQLDQAADRLTLLNSLRKQALQGYFETARTELTFWSLNADLVSTQVELVDGWNAQASGQDSVGDRLRALYDRRQLADAGDGSRYSKIHAALHPLAKRFVVERGYYDFFLISPEGDILYTVEKEDDYGTNLKTGPWRETGLADVYRQALAQNDRVAISDLEAYGPSSGAPAMFMARTMTSPQGKLIGILALQLPTDRIQGIMQFDAGMGDSGETYLVESDKLMRSNSRFSQDSTILKVTVDTDAVQRALDGNQGNMTLPDYRGVMVLSAYDKLVFDNFHWAILAEIDQDEIFREAASSYSQLAGLMALLYALALGSLWLLRPGEPLADEPMSLADNLDIDPPDLHG